MDNIQQNDTPIKILLDHKKIDIPMGVFSNEVTEHIYEKEQKRQQLVKGNWSRKQIEETKKKIKQCLMRKCAHWDSARKYQKYDKVIKIPNIILSSVLSTSLFSQVSSDTQENIKYTFASISGLLTILTALDNYLDFNGLHISHRNASLGYGSLQRSIEVILMKTPENRGSYSEVMERIMAEYSKLRENSPFIPRYILENYEENTEEMNPSELCAIDISTTETQYDNSCNTIENNKSCFGKKTKITKPENNSIYKDHIRLDINNGESELQEIQKKIE